MAFGAFIIGDEILSGRRSDGRLARLIELFGVRGLKLARARYVGDDSARGYVWQEKG